MRYKLLGKSGLRVTELCLGTMTFGEDWGWGASKATSREIFETFANAGGNFIDTSCNYTNGTSEKFIGEFVANDRDHFVIATKYTLNAREDDPNAGGNHRKNLMHSLRGSLKRLNTDYVDLLWLHMWDYFTPIEEVLRALDDVVRAGQVMYIGLSDTPAWVISRADAIAELRGWSKLVAVQAPYSLARRALEREVLPMARALDLAVTPWGLLQGGELTGKYNTATGEPRRYDSASDSNMKLADTLAEFSREFGRSPSQIAINWVRQQTSAQMIPILGARTKKQIDDNLACLDFQLTPDQMERLSNASPIDLGFPRSFLESEDVRGLIHGKTYDQVENHRG